MKHVWLKVDRGPTKTLTAAERASVSVTERGELMPPLVLQVVGALCTHRPWHHKARQRRVCN